MAKNVAKREDLRLKIIGLAEVRIAANGLAGLRARDLAHDAGCALGSLYNVFVDLDELILAVNARTLDGIDAVMSEAARGTAEDQLRGLARVYLNFARENPQLWRALFDHRLPESRQMPDWYANKLTQLMALIGKAIHILQPHLGPQEIALRSRTLFAAVHGVVSISLDNRFIGLAAADLDHELQRFLGLLLAGAAARST